MADDIEPVTIKGRYFFKGGRRFVVKGVTYQVHRKQRIGKSDDPLCDDHIGTLTKCMPLFEELGLNTLFVYTIDPTKNHDRAMRMLARAGIYVIAGLSAPKCAIRRDSPRDSYTPALLSRYFATLDVLSAYPNVLGVIIANEVVNSPANSPAACVIRAVARDVKRYMALAARIGDGEEGDGEGKGQGQRVLPVGVATSHARVTIKQEFEYLSSGREDEAIDFFAFNCFIWVGESSFKVSGYQNLVQTFKDTHIPVFFSEYGANLAATRTFHETRCIYSPQMTPTFSGGVVYEFFEGPNRYGLVKATTPPPPLPPLPTAASETVSPSEPLDLEPLEDFKNLKEKMASCQGDLESLEALEMKDTILGSRPWPPAVSENWRADTILPACPVDWEEVAVQLEDRQWVDVRREMSPEKRGGKEEEEEEKEKEQQEEEVEPSSATSTRSFWRALLPVRNAAKV